MSEERSKGRGSTLAALALALAAAGYFLLSPDEETSKVSAEESPATVAQELEPALNPAPGLPAPRSKAAAPEEQDKDDDLAEEERQAPSCKSDSDCRSPKTADCIQAKCETGSCSFDESGCGCTSKEECNDGNPCTRDHCFAQTKKCIFIPIDDCQ